MGLLALGGADLIWLNGWLVPAILADNADETNSQNKIAIDDSSSHKSKTTPGSIVTNEASPSKENAFNESSKSNSDKVEDRSLTNETTLPSPSEELAHKTDTVEVNDAVNSAETTEVIDAVVAVNDVVNSEESADKRIETTEVIDPINSVETADKGVETAEVIADHKKPYVPEQTATASDYTILFPTDSYTLSKFNLKRIHTISQVIKDTKGRVQLTGHADRRGLAPYNEDLANRRAESVVRELRRLGVRAEDIDSKTMGERAPLANASLSKQRRVEIHLLKRE